MFHEKGASRLALRTLERPQKSVAGVEGITNVVEVLIISVFAFGITIVSTVVRTAARDA